MQLSEAMTAIIRRIDDAQLCERVSFILENASATATALRHLDFRRFEEQHYERGSEVLWRELEPMIAQVIAQMNRFLILLGELFPETDKPAESEAAFDDFDFDLDGNEGSEKPASAPAAAAKSTTEQVQELMWSYRPMLESELAKQLERLQSPNVRSEQWTLLGELSEFRDRTIGALHAMVAAMCGVFQKVRAEELFPDARDTLERLMTLRRELADLELDIDFYNRTIAKAENDELPTLIEMLQGKVIEFISNPAYEFLRPPQKQTMRETASELGVHATSDKFRPTAARQSVDGFAKFLESMRTISLQEVLVDSDKQSAHEGREFLEKAASFLRSDLDQAIFQVMHAVRRLGQLYGVDREADKSYQNLPDIEGQVTSPQAVADLIDELRVVFARFPY
jgi:hypothetical protein